MTETTQTDWDSYWQHSESPDYVNYTPQLVGTIKQYIDLQGCKVLEIGAGTGGNSSCIAALGARVTALDFSFPALQRTKTTAIAMSVDAEIIQSDARSLSFESGSFDLVFHQGFLEHFADPLPLLHEQKRVLRAGGYILIDVPQRYNWYTIHKHQLMRKGCWPYGGWEREFSLRELKTLLENTGFQFVSAYGRGYYPRLWEMLHNMPKAETKLLGKKVLPSRIWKYYTAFWHWYERTVWGCNTLQCVGVLASAK